jgi:hypothetical protein
MQKKNCHNQSTSISFGTKKMFLLLFSVLMIEMRIKISCKIMKIRLRTSTSMIDKLLELVDAFHFTIIEIPFATFKGKRTAASAAASAFVSVSFK